MDVTERSGRIDKRLSTRERSIPEAREALAAEARLLEVLGGRVTPRLLEAGEGSFVMEKIPLPTLAARIERGAAEPAWIERAAVTALEALADLHRAADARGPLEVVHADLSPANLAIAEDAGRVVLLDLGLAVWRESPPRDGAFRGTIAYVAPEVARAERPTVRSDLFALAASLVHAATGRSPRALGALPLAAVLATAAEEPIVDGEIAALAARGPAHAALVACLAHDPAARPACAAEALALARR